jgi:hypothetical protein
MRSDCGDLRVTLSNKHTLLPYWIEPNTCNTSNTKIWAKVPSIPANGTITILVWYGNPQATSQANASAVFIFYDDASSDKSSAYAYRDILEVGPAASLTYDAVNKRYKIIWSSDGHFAYVVDGLSLANAEIEINFITASNFPLNYQFGAIMRCINNSTFIITRALTYYSPDTIELIEASSKKASASLGGDLIAPNTNYRLIARAYESYLYAWISLNDVSITASSTLLSSGEWGIFVAYNTYSIYFNFVKIRQYVNPEPSVSVGVEEKIIGFNIILPHLAAFMFIFLLLVAAVIIRKNIFILISMLVILIFIARLQITQFADYMLAVFALIVLAIQGAVFYGRWRE